MTNAEETYDFIVTGAGLGGLRGRRAAQRVRHVPRAAARGRDADSNPWIHIPLGYTKTYTDPRVNWMFDSEPEKELNGRTLYQPRGKVLGGTSSINGMVYMRGTPTDYDGWRQRGCEGWDYDEVLPFFKKAEDQERGADEFHGAGGPLHVSNPVRCALGDAMVQAAIEAGIPANDDFNGARQEGVGYYQTTTSNRRRWSSARAYLRPRAGRPNLTIATEAHATRILFEGARAVGIEYRTPAGPQTALGARRDRRLGRRLRLAATAAAVGARARAISAAARHPGGARHARRRRQPARPFQHLSGVALRTKGHAQRSGRSPLRKLMAGHAVRLHPLGPSVECRDLRRRFCQKRPAARTARSADQHVRLERARAAAHRHQAAPVLGLHLQPGASAPEGRGTVQIKSPDPLAPPAIRFNFLASDYDFQALIYGTRLSRKIAAQPALKPFVVEEVIPGPASRATSR